MRLGPRGAPLLLVVHLAAHTLPCHCHCHIVVGDVRHSRIQPYSADIQRSPLAGCVLASAPPLLRREGGGRDDELQETASRVVFVSGLGCVFARMKAPWVLWSIQEVVYVLVQGRDRHRWVQVSLMRGLYYQDGPHKKGHAMTWRWQRVIIEKKKKIKLAARPLGYGRELPGTLHCKCRSFQATSVSWMGGSFLSTFPCFTL